MNISDLTLRDLEAVIRLSELRHFGHAANLMHVSQPALSAQIKKVERVLGQTLFERSNREVRLTAIGDSIATQAKIVFEEASKIATISDSSREPLVGEFRLGAIASLGPYYFPKLIRPIRKKFPKLKLLLKEGLTEGLLSELREGKLDAVIASPTFSESGFKTYSLFFDPFVLIAPSGHPILDQKHLEARTLKTDEMVLLEDGHCLKDQTLALCSRSNRGDERGFQATSVETLKHLVASGLGYSVIPAISVEREDPALKGLVRTREFEKGTVGREVILVVRDHYPKMKDIRLLIEFLKTVR